MYYVELFEIENDMKYWNNKIKFPQLQHKIFVFFKWLCSVLQIAIISLIQKVIFILITQFIQSVSQI